MNISSTLNILIVLASMYLCLAVLCSFLNEQIASMLRLRGKTLYEGVQNLLAGESALVEAIYRHPLITASSKDKDGKPATSAKRTYRPSYMEPANFGLALLDTLQRSHFNPQTNALEIDASAKSLIAAPNALFANVKATVEQLPAGDLQRQLVTLLNQAQGSYDRLLSATAAWFSEQMDRVSGWYTRNTRAILMAIAVVVVFSAGIDTIQIASTISSDEASDIVQQVRNKVKEQAGAATARQSVAKATPATNASPAPQATVAPGPTAAELNALANALASVFGNANDAKRDRIVVELTTGLELGIPRRMLQGLADATPVQPACVQVLGAGTVIA
jgi:hypothetical protein